MENYEVFNSAEDRLDILRFIDGFRTNGAGRTMEQVFLGERSYWFAHILSERFVAASIQYDPTEEHFVTAIDGRYYDVRGDQNGGASPSL